MQKVKSFLAAFLCLILIFIIGFFLVNIIMKIIVGHGNEVLVPNLVNTDYNSAIKICEGQILKRKVIEL